MSKLLEQGGFGCVYYPGLKCNGKPNLSTATVTKLQKKDFRADNEIYIGEVIKKIDNFQLFFSAVIKHCSVNLANVDRSILSKCEIIDEDRRVEYVLMDSIYVNGEDFITLLEKLSKKNFINTFFDTYRFLLDTIVILLEHKIVHFDIKADNVLYEKDTNRPILIDFGISLPIEKIDSNNIEKYIYLYAPDYYIWPLEVHILGFLLHETTGKLTQKEAIDIASIYSKNNKALDYFSDSFKAKYELFCIEVAMQYVGMERNKAIKKLTESYTTWDNYTLSIMYLKWFKYFFENSPSEIFILFSQILLSNISPDPNKRLSVLQTKDKFGELFYLIESTETYADFINDFEFNRENIKRKIKSELDSLSNIIKTASVRSMGTK